LAENVIFLRFPGNPITIPFNLTGKRKKEKYVIKLKRKYTVEGKITLPI